MAGRRGTAVIIKTAGNEECPRCGNPLVQIDAKEYPMGTVVNVDLDSRTMATLGLGAGHVWTGEVIRRLENNEPIPTELLGFK